MKNNNSFFFYFVGDECSICKEIFLVVVIKFKFKCVYGL